MTCSQNVDGHYEYYVEFHVEFDKKLIKSFSDLISKFSGPWLSWPPEILHRINTSGVKIRSVLTNLNYKVENLKSWYCQTIICKNDYSR